MRLRPSCNAFGSSADQCRAASLSQTVWVTPLHAAIEFITFDPGYVYQDVSNEAIGIEGPAQQFGSLFVADESTASFTGTLTSVVVAAYGGYPVEMELFQHNPATNLPLVSSAALLGDLATPTTSGNVETFTLTAGGPALLTGESYWLELAPSSPATAIRPPKMLSAQKVAIRTPATLTTRPRLTSVPRQSRPPGQ